MKEEKVSEFSEQTEVVEKEEIEEKSVVLRFGGDVMMTSYYQNPEFAEKALIWLCEQTKEEAPAWLDDLQDFEGENIENNSALPEIG